MTEMVIQIKCSRCGGTGTDRNNIVNGVVVPVSCGVCGGTGYVASAKTDITSIMDQFASLDKKVQLIVDSLKIKPNPK
jgi:DnaJ-class molecular chaperone